MLAKRVSKNKNGPLTEFKLFPNLPSEIRCVIWQYCIAGDNSRIVKIWSTYSWPYYTTVPKFFQVSIEARREAFLAYGLPSLRQDFIRLPPRPLIRYDIDTVFVCDISKSYNWVEDPACKNMRSQLTSLAITESAFRQTFLNFTVHPVILPGGTVPFVIAQIKQSFPNLQELMIIATDNYKFDSPGSRFTLPCDHPKLQMGFTRSQTCYHKMWMNWRKDHLRSGFHITYRGSFQAMQKLWRAKKGVVLGDGDLRVTRGCVSKGGKGEKIWVNDSRGCEKRACKHGFYVKFIKKGP